MRWGGTLLEEARVHSDRKLFTAAPFAFAAAALPVAGDPAPRSSPVRVQVVERVAPDTGGKVSLADAKVVVSGGRGVGSAEGSRSSRSLPALLDGAVGCSRVVTSAGWRPHADQVGQTGTKVSPDLYIACGISGATQHIAGCKGAKKLLAINDDPEATIFAHADYAVIGNLHEIVPAISAELRKARADITTLAGARRARGGARRRGGARSGGARCSSSVSSARRSRSSAPTTCPRRVRNEAVIVLGQRKLFQRLLPGAMHAAIFWGFLVLFPTIVMAMISAVDRAWTFPWLGSQGWFMALVDVFVARGARRRRDRRLDSQGRAARALRRLAPRRGRPHPRADRARRR